MKTSQKPRVILFSRIEPSHKVGRSPKREQNSESQTDRNGRIKVRKEAMARGTPGGSFLYGIAAIFIAMTLVGTPTIQANSLHSSGNPAHALLGPTGGEAFLGGLFGKSKKSESPSQNKKTPAANKGTTLAQARVLPKTAIALPAALEALPAVDCGSSSVLNIVAHEDDDLLFMNPDTAQSIRSGGCVRTIYLTAGDDGRGEAYWLGRQHGAQTAYTAMLGQSVTWQQQEIELASRQHITVSTPAENPKISLIFMNLPDGHLDGSGYGMWDRESLAKLEAQKIAAIYSVNATSQYTSDELTQALAVLIKAYHPTEVRTQSNEVAPGVGDHSDHIATGQFTARATAHYNDSLPPGTPQVPISYYVGYPMRTYPPNLTTDQTIDKGNIFFGYAQFDVNVCGSFEHCSGTSYASYLQRQYKR